MAIPEVGFYRLKQIIGDAKASPPINPLIPISRSSWYAGIQSGKFPPPIKLGPRTSAWPVDSIRQLVATLAEG